MIFEVIKDGEKNHSFMVKGIIIPDADVVKAPQIVLDLDKISPPSLGWKGLRLDSALWIVQEKMLLKLFWEKQQDEVNLIFPMESRNSVRFDEGMRSPRVTHWEKKIWMRAVGVDAPKAFMFILDFDKQ
jgi:hypothetical protein